jgi:hypothetical protein
MRTAAELPQFVRDLLASPPRAGEGVNLYLFQLARALHPYLSENGIADILRVVTAGCGRLVTEKEIRRAVQNSKAAAWTPGSGTPERGAPAWPTLNAEQREAIIAATCMGLVDLWEVSPVRFEGNESHCEGTIDMLFPANPLLCCGKSNSEFATRPREAWRGNLTGMQFIVPSPMTARTGHTQDCPIRFASSTWLAISGQALSAALARSSSHAARSPIRLSTSGKVKGATFGSRGLLKLAALRNA